MHSKSVRHNRLLVRHLFHCGSYRTVVFFFHATRTYVRTERIFWNHENSWDWFSNNWDAGWRILLLVISATLMGSRLNVGHVCFIWFSVETIKEPVSPKVLCAPRFIFQIWKVCHFLDCCEVWFVSSSIAAVSDPKALEWILTWHLSAVV